MKPIIKTIEELYGRREATGEVILDEMAECLRKTRIIAVADLAALMDVNAHQLNMAVHLLTGMTTRDVINRWRLLQAQELLQGKAKEAAFDNGGGTKGASKDECIRRLNAVARRCGWRSYRVLLKVAHRYGEKLEIL